MDPVFGPMKFATEAFRIVSFEIMCLKDISNVAAQLLLGFTLDFGQYNMTNI